MHDIFTPASPEYLLQKLARGEPIFKNDVEYVLRCNEGIRLDGELHELVVMAPDGRLPGKPGPKERFMPWEWTLINDSVDFLAENHREARDLPGYNHIRGALSPVEHALEAVASIWKFGCGRTLQNSLSSRNYRKLR